MRRGFTLVELLVVIAIFVLLLAIAVPAFSSMLYSSEQSLAENSLRMSLGAARDAALRNAAGKDAAAVFFFDRFTGRTSVLPCTLVGVIKDEGEQSSGGSDQALVDREVFVPVAGFEPVQLPRGWSIRGYAGPGMINDKWYGDDPSYVGSAKTRGNWLFPETSFYDETIGDDGVNRQTFMVRFEGGTGALKVSDPSAVLVVSPSPEIGFRGSAPWSTYRVDQETDAARFVRRVASAPPTGGASALSLQARQELLGDVSSDTVLARPVTQIAVYSERKLAVAVGVRLDPSTGCLYQNMDSPMLVSLPGGGAFGDQKLQQVNAWIEGWDLATSQADPTSDCRIFALQKYLGTLQEMTGTLNGQGVNGQ